MNGIKERKEEIEISINNFDEIIKEYDQTIWHIVWKVSRDVKGLLKRGIVTQKEIYNFGLCGLQQSIKRYKDSFNVKFMSYAGGRIEGYMRDELRVITTQHYNSRAYIGKEDSELNNLQIKRKRSQLNISQPLYLYDTVDDFHDSRMLILGAIRDYRYNPELELIKKEDVNIIRKAVESIEDERIRKAVILYFYEDLTCKQIAEAYDVTESRISQLLTKAKKIIKKYLEKYYE